MISALSLAARRIEDKADDGEDKKDEKQDLCNSHRTGRDPAKAEYGGNQRDHEENKGVMQDGGFS